MAVGLTAAALLVASRFRVVQVYAAFLACGLALIPAAQILAASIQPAAPDVAAGQGPEQDAMPVTDARNIWLILTDGYTSPAVVREEAGLDIAPFVDGLARRGFVVPERARSNYPATFASLASLLEMDYLIDEDSQQLGVDRPAINRLISGDNESVRVLRANGYRFVHATPGLWDSNRCVGFEDLCVSGPSPLSETARAMVRMTPVDPSAFGASRRQVAQQADPAWVVNEILDQAPEDPFFAFVHVLSPHPPFLWNDECALRTDTQLQLDVVQTGPDYAADVECLNRQLNDAIDAIVSEDSTAIVVIQGDHGSGIGTDPDALWGVPAERFEVFSALRLGPECEETVPDRLGMTNVMRIVLACVRGTEPQLLPYEAWMVQEGDDRVEPADLPDWE
ncbi:sulfatase-like hydrolase/transferase [Salsipaludibacter albus]|uniref:sulfatase-like hydrolase/transferase n=1 Tax=Salsipaludibacter albus TaxID=2849650 RepID=UPI001EE3D2C7|nr:sulfatase-like hydrolase/transferase [Salsipaludibacter albus]MBY5162929.1 LTA synthase family protein [Salsipaludibacter albus]